MKMSRKDRMEVRRRREECLCACVPHPIHGQIDTKRIVKLIQELHELFFLFPIPKERIRKGGGEKNQIKYQYFFHQLLSPCLLLIDTLTPKLEAAKRSEAETADEAEVCA